MPLADANYSFIWVDIGSYRKCRDSGVFKNSTLYDRLTKNILNIPEPKPIVENDTTLLPYDIVADEAFGMMENLMRPYGGLSLSYPKYF